MWKIVTALLLAASCATEEDRSGAPTVGALPGGGTLVDNGPLIHRLTEPPWTVVEDGRIGAVDGTGPDVFGEVDYFAVGDDGDLFVLDGQAQELRHFAADGRYLSTVATKGSGPGELAGAYGVTWDPDGRLFITDINNRRYTVFTPAGELVASHRRTINGVIYPWMARFVQGRLLDIGLVRPGAGPNSVGAFNRFQFLHWRADFSFQDTLGFLDFPIHQVTGRRVSQPFAPRVTVALTAHGTVWFADNHEYRFIERTFAGDTIRIISLPLDPQEVTLAERDSAVGLFKGTPITIARADIYPTKPIVQRLVPTADGGLIVIPFVAGEVPGAVFDVFGPEGAYQGRVTSPTPLDHMPPPQLRGELLYAVTKDALDVEYVVRLRVTRLR